MDSDCCHLVYVKADKCGDADDDDPPCQHCSDCAVHALEIPCPERAKTPYMPFERALTGPMVRYIQLVRFEEFESPPTLCELFDPSETPVCYVKQGLVVSLQGEIHMQDVPPHGTWLSAKNACLVSLERLRLAGLICVRLPELNRIVLEQKNDDGLLHLAQEWLQNDNVNEAIQLFGPFACDAMLAPVLHKILRFDSVDQHNKLSETNNELKLGWAQEFYDWKCLTKNASGSTLFGSLYCPCKGVIAHTYKVVSCILDKMRWCGYTPWSAVQAVRVSEARIKAVPCTSCRQKLFASCAFLMECAAVEASREHDRLVRNEAVIELCWLLYQLGNDPEESQDKLKVKVLEAWAEAVVKHSVSFHECLFEQVLSDVHALVVLFAINHLPLESQKRKEENPENIDKHCVLTPDRTLLDLIARNDRFSSKWTPAPQPSNLDKLEICANVDVPTEVPDSMEAGPQRVEAIALALLACFPRVAASSLCDLTFEVPCMLGFCGRLWPVFVNPTRACYQLFRALALPSSPSPMYVLELLARSWRIVRREALQSLIPTSSCGTVKVSREHNAKYLEGPVRALFQVGAINDSERDLMLRVLSRGVLPCFAVEGDSPTDRLVSSTLAFAFAASGIRVFGLDEGGEDDLCGPYCLVTKAGLLYFAAWYVLVYATAVHAHPTLKAQLSRNGTDADWHLSRALKLARVTAGSNDYKVQDHDGGEILQALRITLGGQLSDATVCRCAEIYIPELLMQLPYAKKLNSIPGSVKKAIENRDVWFAQEHETDSVLDPSKVPFAYLGEIAHGLHSSIRGTLIANDRPTAQALRGVDREFDPWCDTLLVQGLNEDTLEEDLAIEAMMRMKISEEENETYYDLD